MKAVNGIFVPANDEQLAKIWEAVAANNFPLDSNGILSLLMAFIENDGEDEDEEETEIAPDPMESLLHHFAKNPEHAEALKQAGAKLFKNLFNKKG